jgi:hypothetical protein
MAAHRLFAGRSPTPVSANRRPFRPMTWRPGRRAAPRGQGQHGQMTRDQLVCRPHARSPRRRGPRRRTADGSRPVTAAAHPPAWRQVARQTGAPNDQTPTHAPGESKPHRRVSASHLAREIRVPIARGQLVQHHHGASPETPTASVESWRSSRRPYPSLTPSSRANTTPASRPPPVASSSPISICQRRTGANSLPSSRRVPTGSTGCWPTCLT